MQPQVSVSHKDTSPRRPDSEAGFSARTGHEEIQSALSSDWPVVSIRWVDAEARGGPGWEDPEDMTRIERSRKEAVGVITMQSRQSTYHGFIKALARAWAPNAGGHHRKKTPTGGVHGYPWVSEIQQEAKARDT